MKATWSLPQLKGFRGWTQAALCAVLLIGSGCRPEIGDDCAFDIDCTGVEQRVCDTDQPNGYCTILGCDAGDCPDEALCVAYGSQLSRAEGCVDTHRTSRLLRTFCLRRCETDDDCRDGYLCIDLSDEDNPWGARVAEDDLPETGGRACVVPFSAVPVPATAESGVCSEPANGE